MPSSDLHEPLLAWYAAHARDLPWRRPDRTPWGVLVSEVMLQQTPVERVVPAWEAWLRRWPAPADLARDPAGEAVRMWGRLSVDLLRAATPMLVEPGDPIDKNIYDLPPEEAAEIRQVPGSLDAALAALEADHDFLLEGDVFSPDLISTYIDYKRSVEIDPVRLRPHPYEYFLYYDL